MSTEFSFRTAMSRPTSRPGRGRPSLTNVSVWRTWLPDEPLPPIWLERHISSADSAFGPNSTTDYRAGDWNVVNEIALRLLADADGVDLDDVAEHALAAAADDEELDAWTLDALSTLFIVPISYGVTDDSTKDFSNRIHRTQAMRDAGVVTTITAEDELVEPDVRA